MQIFYFKMPGKKRNAFCSLLAAIPFFLFAQQPKLVLPVGHSSIVVTAAYSPDDKFIVTASWDNTAKVWQASDGKLLFELKGHFATVTSASFSPDGNYIVTSSKDNTAKIWSALDGKFLSDLKGHTDYVSSAEYSPDGKCIVTASWDKTAKVWDAGSGDLLFDLKGHEKLLSMASYSTDGKKIITASWDGTVKIWDALNGRLLNELKVPHADAVEAARLSPDGKYIAASTLDSAVKILDASNGNLLFELKGHTGLVKSVMYDRVGKYILTASADSTAKIWNASSGKLHHELRGHSNWVNDAAFSNDGKYIVTASSDRTARIWETSNGVFLHELTGHVSMTSYAAFSKDQRFVISVSTDSIARIWDNETGRLLKPVVRNVNWMCPVVFSPDGKHAAIALFDNSVGIYDLPELKLQHKLIGHTDWVTSICFSEDGKNMATASWDSTAKIWNAVNGVLLHDLRLHHDVVDAATFSKNGTYLVTASWDGTARLWSVPGGKLVYNLKGHKDKLRTASFSADGKYIVTASWDSTAKIWNAVNGRLVFTLKGHHAFVNSACFSPDGKLVATCSMDSTAKIWDATTGRLLHNLKGHANAVISVIFSRNGKKIYTSSWDNKAGAWEVAHGKMIYWMEGHSAPLNSLVLSEDDKYILTSSEDDIIKKWETGPGSLIYNFFVVDSNDYLTVDKEGRFDGTEAARKKIYYVCNNESIDLEQFKNLAWEPGLAAKLNGVNQEPVTARDIADIDICNYTPVVEEKGIDSNSYLFQITPRRGGIKVVQLYVNNKLTREYATSDLVKNGNAYLLSVGRKDAEEYFVSDADNRVSVRALTQNGVMQSRGAEYTTPVDNRMHAAPDIYIISVGVSNYKSAGLQLKYAAKDACDFSSAISSSAKKLFNVDGRQHVFTYSFATGPGNRYYPFKAAIRNVIDTIIQKARADDILVAFFAGHGIMQSPQKKFYMLTADAADFNIEGIEKEVAISTDELNEWSRKIKANKQVLILDACSSGEVINSLQPLSARGDIPADQQRALENLKDKTGIFILSASESGQAANETSIYDQGLLTYSLLSGIKLGGGLKDKKFIDVSRWFNFVSDDVKKLARDIGKKQDPQILGNASFDIGIVDRQVADSLKLSMKKKIFRRSKFIEDEELLTDDLDFSGLVDKELNDLSEKGRESPLFFAADNIFDSAYSVHGKYSVSGNGIVAKITLIKGVRQKLYQFELKGTVGKKEDLVHGIVEKIKTYFRFGSLLSGN